MTLLDTLLQGDHKRERWSFAYSRAPRVTGGRSNNEGAQQGMTVLENAGCS